MTFRPRWLVAGSLAIAAVLASAFWLKSNHTPEAPIALAQEFIGLLQARQFPQAHALTLHNGYVGRNPTELEAIAQAQLCGTVRFAHSAPPQTHGNRLRRWLNGSEVEMPEVQVEFESSGGGACLLGVTLRHTGAGQWKVFRFASHAG